MPQLLFYEAAVPVSAARHGSWSIVPRDRSFSPGINSVPLTTVEFAAAAAEHAIVFAGQPRALVPAAILGMRAAQNLYLDAKGAWNARYVQGYAPEFQRTRDFCRKLEQLEPLEPVQAQSTLSADERVSLTGFLAVSRDRLKALPAAKLAELTQSDELEILDLHLLSMRNFAAMRGRLAGTSIKRPLPDTLPPPPDTKASEPRGRKKAEKKLAS